MSTYVELTRKWKKTNGELAVQRDESISPLLSAKSKNEEWIQMWFERSSQDRLGKDEQNVRCLIWQTKHHIREKKPNLSWIIMNN